MGKHANTIKSLYNFIYAISTIVEFMDSS